MMSDEKILQEYRELMNDESYMDQLRWRPPSETVEFISEEEAIKEITDLYRKTKGPIPRV